MSGRFPNVRAGSLDTGRLEAAKLKLMQAGRYVFATKIVRPEFDGTDFITVDRHVLSPAEVILWAEQGVRPAHIGTIPAPRSEVPA